MNRTATDVSFATADIEWKLHSSRAASALSSRLIPVATAVTLVAFTFFHLMGLDSNWRPEIALLILAITIIAAWFCSPKPILFLTLATTGLCCIFDICQESAAGVHQIATTCRLIGTVWLVVCISRARRDLELARQLARIDGLTGLPNRQAILEAIDAELCRVRRFGRSFSIALLDCDGFKAINDVQGHLAGDAVLQKLAVALRKQTRAYDCVGRLGGDEFVLIFSEATSTEVRAIIERLQAGLHQELNTDFPTLSFSIGVTTIQAPVDGTICTIDRFECLQRADNAMYAAKRSGKNQIHYSNWSGELDTEDSAQTSPTTQS
jgi:diguanylate cyclase (GGDEF)-like protein